MAGQVSTVFITGATGKLGRKYAFGFAALGWNIAFTTRGGQGAEEVEKGCFQRGAGRVCRVQLDLTLEGAPAVILERLAEQDMLPHVLINNARDLQYLRTGPGGRTTRQNWQGEFLLDVILPYELTTNLAQINGSPLRSVINIASIYGISAANPALYVDPENESPVNYSVAKAALIHLTRELAVRLASQKVAVNSISYGGVAGRKDENFQQRYGRLCPIGRMLDDSEVFGAVKFLASEDSSGMTGHNLVVDGGWTIW